MRWIVTVIQKGSKQIVKQIQKARTISKTSKAHEKTTQPVKRNKLTTAEDQSDRQLQANNKSEKMTDNAKREAQEEGGKLKEKGLTTEERYTPKYKKETDNENPYRSREIAKEKPPYEPEIQPPSTGLGKGKGTTGIEP